MLQGIVLAAGASQRMGRPKARLPLGTGGDTFAGRIVRTLLDAGLPRVVIVTGAERLEAGRGGVPRDRRVRLVHHGGWAEGQLSSLLAGLDAVEEPATEAVLVTLVDVPLVRPSTVRTLVSAWRATRAPVVRPVHGARHGHPVIFDRAVFASLRAADPARGAKAVVEAHRGAIVEVEVDDAGAFRDFDRPEDLAGLES